MPGGDSRTFATLRLRNYEIAFSLQIMKTLTVALLLIASCVLTAEGQQVINVQFTDGKIQEGLNGQAWSTSISPLAYTGTTYNYGDITESDLAYSDASSSAVGFTLTGPSNLANNDGSAPLPMFREVEYSYEGDLTLTINGLQNGQAYNVALDAAFNGGDGSAFTVGSNTQQDTGNNNGSTFVAGINYVEFDSVVATDNSIVVTIAANNTGQNFANINGFQIEVVPEPSTYAMMIGGLAFLAFCVRRKLAV
jgi:hypothetical protein